MTKDELVRTVNDKNGLPKEEMTRIVDGIFAAITAALSRGEKVTLRGFATFTVKEHKARSAAGVCRQNVPTRRLCKFIPSGALKAAVKG